MKELPKVYEPQKHEDSIYSSWETSGFFNPDNLSGEPYSIMMPPPNVTGVLHLGHALENTLMDTMARYQRMQGKKVLIVPGTDHAAVATQARVEKLLMDGGMKNPRQELGREGLLEKIREYAEESKATILSQIRKMGTSCDWSRLAYTYDEKRNTAVNQIFKKMYDDGLIYRGYRVVNWSVSGQSTASDDELVHVERTAKLYTFKYTKDFPIAIATTRPETKLGDTAVAVNPKDRRYKKYIGQTFTIDVGAEKPLEIKIIADENVDKDFGTGALGVTPAHSQIDFEMYEKQKAVGNDIGLIQVIGMDGKMTAEAGKNYVGLTVEDAREKFVEYLKDNHLLEKEEEIVQNVGTSDRFKDVVEALPMTQWFVAVNKEVPGRGKTLKELVVEAVATGHNGDADKKISLIPEGQLKRHTDRIENLHDWCISRQIWWGHRIPVWYKGEDLYVGDEFPGEGWVQDEDTLDTWFSAGTWTFSTLGWPEKTKDLETFHPTSFIQMGHEILFLWFQRMVMLSTYVLDEIPFKDVYIHGLLRNEQGKKFSKSDGNTADPLDIIAKYGTDALRYSVIAGISPGNDSRFYQEKIEGARNLVTKLWNMSKFMLMNIANPKKDIQKPEPKTLADRWILEKLDNTVFESVKDLEKYSFSLAAERLRDFTWSELADWYLEIAKIEGEKDDILNYILNTILKLWHPYLPFVTEAVWQEVYGAGEILMVERWPVVDEVKDNEHNDFEKIRGLVVGIRSVRADYRIEPAKKINILLKTKKVEIFEDNKNVIMGLSRLESLVVAGKVDKLQNAISFVASGAEVFVDLVGAIDVEKEKTRLEKELAKVSPFVHSLEKKLDNRGFTDNAPLDVLAGEKKKLEEAKEKLTKLKQQLLSLS